MENNQGKKNILQYTWFWMGLFVVLFVAAIVVNVVRDEPADGTSEEVTTVQEPVDEPDITEEETTTPDDNVTKEEESTGENEMTEEDTPDVSQNEEDVVEEEPTKEPVQDVQTYSDGQYIVGTDIQPGLYYAENGVSYFERSKGFSGSFDDIIANDTGSTGPQYVEIKATDKGVKVQGGTLVPFDKNNHDHKILTSFGDGVYLVGVDIEPGTYKATGSGYWERTRSVSKDLDDIIANANPTGNAVVQILPGDFAFKTSGLRWEKAN
ncbi:hypothetical protein CN918_30375 [Priestia megaterium]|nr:hypothetical protein CN918_30375 [Priestia megaterium]